MKKIISLILVLVMVLSMAVAASATEEIGSNKAAYSPDFTLDDNGAGSTSTEVTVTIGSGETVPVYYVSVNWDSMEFTYNNSSKATWDPENHIYKTEGTTGWNKTKANVVVTNHSSEKVTVDANFENGTKTSATKYSIYATIAATEGETTGVLDSGIGLTFEQAKSVTYTVELVAPATPEAAEATFKLDEITVSISDPAKVNP